MSFGEFRNYTANEATSCLCDSSSLDFVFSIDLTGNCEEIAFFAGHHFRFSKHQRTCELRWHYIVMLMKLTVDTTDSFCTVLPVQVFSFFFFHNIKCTVYKRMITKLSLRFPKKRFLGKTNLNITKFLVHTESSRHKMAR